MCPVCFGGDEPVMRESLNAGIGVLMGVTSVVLGCFARFAVVLAQRARAYAEIASGESLFEDVPGQQVHASGSIRKP